MELRYVKKFQKLPRDFSEGLDYSNFLRFGGKKQEALGAAWVRKAAESGSPDGMWLWAQMAEEGGT